jgi:hypothetical protein
MGRRPDAWADHLHGHAVMTARDVRIAFAAISMLASCSFALKGA